LELLEFKKFI